MALVPMVMPCTKRSVVARSVSLRASAASTPCAGAAGVEGAFDQRSSPVASS
jgi:hypothetical protein